jgi:hypothetical protein
MPPARGANAGAKGKGGVVAATATATATAAVRRESDASTASTTSTASMGGAGLNGNKSYASWISDDFTASVHFDATKKMIYNCNPTPSKIDVETGSVLLLNESGSSTAPVGQHVPQNGVSSGNLGGAEAPVRRLSLLTPLYTCIDIVQYFLPSRPARPELLPLNGLSGASDASVTRTMLDYVYRVTEELKDSIVATPVTAVRSVGALMSFIYKPADTTKSEGGSSSSSSGQSGQNVTEYPVDSSAAANLSSPNLHDPGAQFDHTVKVFDRSMYWTTKANLVTKAVKGKGKDATVTGITMEIAPWTWRHHPLHHFHLSNDIKQLEYLFELGIHDAFVHHAELAEFFNTNLDDL